MPFDLASLLPPSLSPAGALVLIITSTLTSTITATLGMGGGMTLLSVMAFFVPADLLIPIHGIVQTGSNGGRVAVLLGKVHIPTLHWFVPGSVFGIALGGLVAVELPSQMLRGLVGTFVLVTTWTKVGLPFGATKGSLFIGGFVSSLLTMFVGATGPFLMSVLRKTQLPPQELLATAAFVMLLQHGLKIGAYGLLGRDFTPWLAVLVAMIAFGFIGTLIGTSLLKNFRPTVFSQVLRILLTVVGLSLIFSALPPL